MAGALAPLGEELSLEKRALAEALRKLFLGLETSVRRYAVRRHRDPGTLSRYLNGSRTPPWEFVTDLITDLNERGRPITPDVEQLLRTLHREALSSTPHAHELQKLQDELAEADKASRQADVQQQALTELLQDRERRLADLQNQLRLAERVREEDRISYAASLTHHQDTCARLQAQRDQLLDEVCGLREALHTAKLAADAAEHRCDELENALKSAENQLGEASAPYSLVEALETADRTATVPQLIDLVNRLGTPARRAMATELVAAAARERPAQEAAALIEALYAVEQHQHAQVALQAMVLVRPIHETAALLAEFARARLDPAAAVVLQTALDAHSPYDIAVIAADLHARGVPELKEHITVVLGSALTIKPFDYAVELLKALDASGALHLAEPAVAVCGLRRSVWDLAELISILTVGGFAHLANIVRDSAAARPAKEVVDLVDALRREEMVSQAEHVLSLSAENGETGHVAALVAALSTENLQDLAGQVLSRAIREWPVGDIAELIADFWRAGEAGHAVITLSDTVHILPTEDFCTLFKALDFTTAGNADTILAHACAVAPHNDLAALITALDRSQFHGHADRAFWMSIGNRTTGHAALLISSLRGSDSRHVSQDALRAYGDTRPISDVAALSVALDATGLRHDVHTCVLGAGPQARFRILTLLPALDGRPGGPHLADDLLRELAERCSTEENIELALALDSLPLRGEGYRRVFHDAACGAGGHLGSKKDFPKELRRRKKALRKAALKSAKQSRGSRRRTVDV
ncbi:hypothetical protein FGW37_17070 [Streptomyces rectiverticillatus]|uniref:hypothetical protein n=1 Tax=Streptomyces rectiverticillatus TaxID=173860 RepID=UPI0015C32588|nr:hypothetical protein [Streptomyces rectiverticillatus]QLE73080.1 hypothetical protein FGW37_17070 [Streptomyces rectiverticillatus]